MVSRAVSVLLLLACVAVVANATSLAICRFQGSSTITGWLTLTQEEENGDVIIGANFTSSAAVSGLYMHIHQAGDLGASSSCFSAETYGPWSSETEATHFTDSRSASGFSLVGSNSIVGRSIHLYESSDCDASADTTAVASCTVGIRNFAASELYDANTASQVLTADPVSAHVTLVGGASAPNLTGEAWFVPTTSGMVFVKVHVKGLSAGSTHAIHVHTYGDIHLATGLSAGLHLNPAHVNHGYPPSPHRHMGDLGNFTADAEGTVSVSELFDLLSFTASSGNIIGRGLIVHTLGDDANPLNTNTSTGAAGGRLGMGVVGISTRLPDGFVDPTSADDTMETARYAAADFQVAASVATATSTSASAPLRQLQVKAAKASAKLSAAKAKRAARRALAARK